MLALDRLGRVVDAREAGAQRSPQGRGDLPDDLVLQRQEVIGFAVVTLAPEDCAGVARREFRADPDARAGAAHCAVQDVGGGEGPGGPVFALPPVLETPRTPAAPERR